MLARGTVPRGEVLAGVRLRGPRAMAEPGPEAGRCPGECHAGQSSPGACCVRLVPVPGRGRAPGAGGAHSAGQATRHRLCLESLPRKRGQGKEAPEFESSDKTLMPVMFSRRLCRARLWSQGGEPGAASAVARGRDPVAQDEPGVSGTPEAGGEWDPRARVSGTPRPGVSGTPEPGVSGTPRPGVSGTPRPGVSGTPRPGVSGTPEPG